ncbi:MAG TPA: HRDC domain-containing protein [Candidatus Sulfotelmatobacter sp.]|nr:HRDC domain-containing protein [Candidatus Sulfotelmatobacter sp.]
MSEARSIAPAPEMPPAWVRSPCELTDLGLRLARARRVALDTESNSLHHFPEQVCLLQVAEEDGRISLVDPLALGILDPLAAAFGSPAVIKVLHGAAYDLSSLKRDFGFAFAGIFDTMLAAQFLGLPEVGLSALLQRYFGIAPGVSRQKDDWTVRPLRPDQEAYAAADVRWLLALRTRLGEELEARGRHAWVEEECKALAALLPAERAFDPEDALRLKGASQLDSRGLAILRELFTARQAWAHETGRPPFRVLGNDTLLALAGARPRGPEDLGGLPGMTPRAIARYGAGILRAVARGEAVPDETLPVRTRPKRPRVAAAVERRTAALSAWRAQAASRFSLDPGLLLPRRLIEQLAELLPHDTEGLAGVPGFRRWRVEAFGHEILRILAG